MPWLCRTISMMLGVAINSDQRERLIASPAVAMSVYGAPAPNSINRQLPFSKMPWLYSTISMMLGVAINSNQRKRWTASPAVVMPVYGTPAPNTINRQLPSSKMPWLCSTISMMLGVAINSDQRKRQTASPRWEKFQDTNPKAISEESALPTVAMPVYSAPAPNTINRQLPSSKMSWLCSTISMMLGVAINSDQRKKLTASPRWERFQDTNPKAISEESNVLHTMSSPPTLIYLSKHLPSLKSRGRSNQ